MSSSRSATPAYNRSSAIALLVVSSILWGSSFVSIKIGLAYVNAFDFAFLRLAVASVILLIPLIWRGMRFSLLREPVVWGLGLLNGFGFMLQYTGLVLTTAAKTALLVDLNVIAVAILSWKFYKEPMTSSKLLGVVLGVMGAVLITTNGNPSAMAHGELSGDVLVFLAGLSWAAFIVLHKKFQTQKQMDPVELSAVVMVITALSLFPSSLVFGSLGFERIPLQGWEWIGFIALACTVVPYAIWVAALRAVSATVAAIMGMLEIVVAMILSTVFLGEAYSNMTLIGAVLILLSVFAVAES